MYFGINIGHQWLGTRVRPSQRGNGVLPTQWTGHELSWLSYTISHSSVLPCLEKSIAVLGVSSQIPVLGAPYKR